MKVLLITPRSGGPWKSGAMLAEFLNKNKISTKHVSGLWNTINSLLTFKPDIIHSSSPVTWFLWKKPYILTVKGSFKKELKSRILFWKNAIKNAAVVQVNTEFLKNILNLKNAVIIPNTIKLKKIRKIKSRLLRLLTITSFDFPEKAKGALDLVKIVKNVCEKNKIKAELVLVGGGRCFEEIKIKSKYLKLTQTGKLNREQTEKELSKASLFLYNSYLDNFPNVFLEALLYKLPIISNDVGGVREIITDGKEGFIATSEKEYEQKLLKLIKNSNLQKEFSKNAELRVKYFDEDRVLHQYIKLYKSLIRK